MSSEQHKYYTPTIEEFCVGFEFEVNSGKPNGQVENWFKYVFRINDFVAIKKYIEDNLVRVKLLDRADIEGEGWKFEQENDMRDYFKKVVSYRGDNIIFKMCYMYSTGWLLVWVDETDNGTRFSGNIRNITELRKLLNQLGL